MATELQGDILITLGYIYLFGNVLLKCSFLSLVLSNPKTIIWEEVASLPVKDSTLVTVKGHLHAGSGRRVC